MDFILFSMQSVCWLKLLTYFHNSLYHLKRNTILNFKWVSYLYFKKNNFLRFRHKNGTSFLTLNWMAKENVQKMFWCIHVTFLFQKRFSFLGKDIFSHCNTRRAEEVEPSIIWKHSNKILWITLHCLNILVILRAETVETAI